MARYQHRVAINTDTPAESRLAFVPLLLAPCALIFLRSTPVLSWMVPAY